MHDRTLLLAAVDLPALADELLGGSKGTGRAARWSCPNPDHHSQTGRTPPVTVYDSHRGEQRWRCHACGDGGTAIDLITRTHNLGARGALDELARRTGITPNHEPTAPRRRPTPRRTYEPPPPQPASPGLRRYVNECARRMWEPAGSHILDWLIHTRGLPADVLAHNHIGADIGARQGRPWGLATPAGGAVVFPVAHDGDLVYAQLRLLEPPPGRDRWLNPTHRLAPNPRIALYQPTERHHREVIVTEGAVDALSATAAGYTAAAVLGVGLVHNPVTATLLARIPAPLVLAFDPDPAGDRGIRRLPELLATHGRATRTLALAGGDLNDHHRHAGVRWPEVLTEHVQLAAQPITAETLSR